MIKRRRISTSGRLKSFRIHFTAEVIFALMRAWKVFFQPVKWFSSRGSMQINIGPRFWRPSLFVLVFSAAAANQDNEVSTYVPRFHSLSTPRKLVTERYKHNK